MYTSVVMAAGCGIFMLSSFTPIRHFGSLMVLTVISALMMDMLVLPWLLRFFRVMVSR